MRVKLPLFPNIIPDTLMHPSQRFTSAYMPLRQKVFLIVHGHDRTACFMIEMLASRELLLTPTCGNGLELSLLNSCHVPVDVLNDCVQFPRYLLIFFNGHTLHLMNLCRNDRSVL